MHLKYLSSAAIWILFIFLFTGCEKDHIVTPPVINLDQGAEFLQLLEAKGDYVNTHDVPFISADDLYLEKDNVAIIDVRGSSDYSLGHIEGAINIPSSALFDTVANTSKWKIVLVSATGEASAYYALLLRIVGFNVYSLKFGMASWNSFFSDIWLSRIADFRGSSVISSELKEKVIAYKLPDPGLDAGGTIQDQLIVKIKKLLAQGFTEDPNSTAPVASHEFTTIREELYKYYIVCAGPPLLYYSKLLGTYHLIGATNYLIEPYRSDFRSISNLQCLPDDKEILIYSGSGQESAFFTAYLRLLGYNASSMLLGCNSFSYSMLTFRGDLTIYQFNNTVIRNYPYIQ